MRGWWGRAALAVLLLLGVLVALPATPAAASAGELDLTDATAQSRISDLTLDGGILGGGADVVVISSFDLTSGRLAGNGTFVVGPAASMTIGPGAAKVITRNLTVAGTLHWTG